MLWFVYTRKWLILKKYSPKHIPLVFKSFTLFWPLYLLISSSTWQVIEKLSSRGQVFCFFKNFPLEDKFCFVVNFLITGMSKNKVNDPSRCQKIISFHVQHHHKHHTSHILYSTLSCVEYLHCQYNFIIIETLQSWTFVQNQPLST